MIYLFAAVFVIMWALGLLSTGTMSGLMLLLAVVVGIIHLLRLIAKRRILN